MLLRSQAKQKHIQKMQYPKDAKWFYADIASGDGVKNMLSTSTRTIFYTSFSEDANAQLILNCGSAEVVDNHKDHPFSIDTYYVCENKPITVTRAGGSNASLHLIYTDYNYPTSTTSTETFNVNVLNQATSTGSSTINVSTSNGFTYGEVLNATFSFMIFAVLFFLVSQVLIRGVRVHD